MRTLITDEVRKYRRIGRQCSLHFLKRFSDAKTVVRLNAVLVEHPGFETRLHLVDEAPRLLNVGVPGAPFAHAALEVDLQSGQPFAQSIGVLIARGVAAMAERRRLDDVRKLCAGPGRLTQALGIDGTWHGGDLCADAEHAFAARLGRPRLVADERIGISTAAELPWRFTLAGSAYVSVKPRVARD